MPRPTALVAFCLVTVAAVAACNGNETTVGAGGGTNTVETSAPPPPGRPEPDGLVLQIRTGGGFVPAEFAFSEFPEFTLLADGRVVVTGPTTAEYPGRALPNVLVGTVGNGEVAGAVASARDAGVTQAPDLGRPPVADAPTTTFVLVEGDRTHQVDAYALEFDDAEGLTAGQRDARARLRALAERMQELGGAAVDPYRTDAVSVLVVPYPDRDPATPSVDPEPGEAEWPLADLGTGGSEQLGGRCLGFTGPDAQGVIAAAEEARSNTRWRSGGRAWSLSFRPELPGVAPCGER